MAYSLPGLPRPTIRRFLLRGTLSAWCVFLIGADLFVDLVASLRLFKRVFATVCLKLGDEGAGDDDGIVF